MRHKKQNNPEEKPALTELEKTINNAALPHPFEKNGADAKKLLHARLHLMQKSGKAIAE